MKLTALPYLQEVIAPTIKKIFEFKKSCEVRSREEKERRESMAREQRVTYCFVQVDPTREKEEHIPENFKRLLQFVNELTESIFSSASKCPKYVSPILSSPPHTLAEACATSSRSCMSPWPRSGAPNLTLALQL